MRREYKTKKEKKDYYERHEFWKAVEGYFIEVGCKEDGKIDTCKFKKWCESKSIPIPKLFRDFEEKSETKEEEK